MMAVAVILPATVGAGTGEIVAGEVIIEADAVRPMVLVTEAERRVVFVNHSARPVHVQFLMGDGRQHHLIQVPDRIWAVFHQTGRHPFVVHVQGPEITNLYGAVEVVGDPFGRPDPRVCSGITVMGACIER